MRRAMGSDDRHKLAGARPARLLVTALLAFEGALGLCTAYLIALALAAADALRTAPQEGLGEEEPTSLAPRMVVLIPAHDEELGIGATLASLERASYPRQRLRVVVIADNCSDRTADRARATGVEVWERVDLDRRGKGCALAWAISLLQAEEGQFDAVVVLDADCLVSPNMLSAIGAELRAGANVVQVSYEVANPGDSYASALRFAAFALMDRVRPLGKQRLGLSCGLFGTGMAFRRELLQRVPWTAIGLTEDGEYHLRLVAAGERVRFLQHAWVRSPMPTSLAGSADQQARWEQGKLDLIRGWTLKLLATGVARRDIVRAHAGLEHLVPPQSLLVAGSVGSSIAGVLLGSRRLRVLAAATLAGQLAFVLSGLRLVRAPLRVYLALLAAPLLVLSKLVLYARLLARRGPSTWVRTEREATPMRATR
ncbi:MAG TPA: glycosyltransferase family 2 protein [Solirubrobacteraceae bacterium]|nr:glycosyltransferase family 2 protein [Solirubrobacteraceae bacterium]